MTDPYWDGGPGTSDAPGCHPSAEAASYRAADGSPADNAGPLIPYYGPDGQVAYHPAPEGWHAAPEAAYAAPAYPPVHGTPQEAGGRSPDPGWAALREAVWESGAAPPNPWPEGPARGPVGTGAEAPAATPDDAGTPPEAHVGVADIESQRSTPPAPAEAVATLTVPVTDIANTTTPAHKVVPRPTAAHRISTERSTDGARFRPSQVPYRIGIARRLRSGFALVLISVVLAGMLTAVLVALVAGIASAISHAASS